jgi:hypothetical protein
MALAFVDHEGANHMSPSRQGLVLHSAMAMPSTARSDASMITELERQLQETREGRAAVEAQIQSLREVHKGTELQEDPRPPKAQPQPPRLPEQDWSPEVALRKLRSLFSLHFKSPYEARFQLVNRQNSDFTPALLRENFLQKFGGGLSALTISEAFHHLNPILMMCQALTSRTLR